ncbi:uncharacterized protein BO87DRAFT_315421, partial [Aspergillus neoniger CBS 115656]
GILRPTRHAATARAGKLGQVLGVQPDDEMCQKGGENEEEHTLVDEELIKDHEAGRLMNWGDQKKKGQMRGSDGREQQNKKLVGRGVQRTAERENQEALLKLDRHT